MNYIIPQSKVVFLSRARAEQHIPEFTARCCDTSHFDYAESAGLVVSVVEFDFDDSNQNG